MDILDDIVEGIRSLRSELKRKDEKIASLEKLRPHWAQGCTSDSGAAQASISAKSQLWDLLGVDNQTAAVARIEELLEAEQQLSNFTEG